MSNSEVATTIIQQIKSQDFWFLARIGYNSPVYSDDSITFKANGSKVGHVFVKITLNAMDTYDIKIFKVRRVKWDIKTTIIKEIEGIYFGSLIEAIQSALEGR